MTDRVRPTPPLVSDCEVDNYGLACNEVCGTCLSIHTVIYCLVEYSLEGNGSFFRLSSS